MDIVKALQARMRDQPDRRAIEFRGKWFTWGDLARVGDRIDSLLREDGVPVDATVGVVVRNSFAHAATLLGLMAAGRSIQMMYASQPAAAVAAEVERLGLAAVVATERDFGPEVTAGARRAGSLAISLSDPDGYGTRIWNPQAPQKQRSDTPRRAEPALYVLTSGTTGRPKSLPMPFKALRRAVISAALGADTEEEPPAQIVCWPFSGVGGLCQLMACGVTGTPFTLLERFSVEDFVAAVKRNRPSWISLPPTGVRMILDAHVPADDLSSVKAVFGGSAVLQADVQDAFEQRYDCTIYWAYGATEFSGTIISWTPKLRAEFGKSKRGSSGRVMDGVQIRVVDPESGAEVPRGSDGLLQALVPEVNADWIKTSDIVMVDADGFVFHRGRNDSVIVRGGFKIWPDTVVNALRSHPQVGDAAVVGIADERLGQVPVAAVESKPGVEPPTADDLESWVRRSLPATHVPVAWRIVEALPRMSSMKPSLTAVRTMFEDKT